MRQNATGRNRFAKFFQVPWAGIRIVDCFWTTFLSRILHCQIVRLVRPVATHERNSAWFCAGAVGQSMPQASASYFPKSLQHAGACCTAGGGGSEHKLTMGNALPTKCMGSHATNGTNGTIWPSHGVRGIGAGWEYAAAWDLGPPNQLLSAIVVLSRLPVFRGRVRGLAWG
jgi:hypothetical protein